MSSSNSQENTDQILDSIVGSHVLIVDDSPLVFRALSRILKRENLTFHHAIDGKSTFEYINSIYFNEGNPSNTEISAILLDLVLPDTNGLEICKRLKSQVETKNIPILVITGEATPESHLKALDAGADDFVPKPPNPKILMKRLQTLILQRRAIKENNRLLKELETYISKATINKVQTETSHPSEQIEAAILFSDMRGFTAASYDNKNEEVFDAINVAMEFQSQIVQQFNGYVDGFSGDGMLAVFDQENCALDACRAAQMIIEKSRQTSLRIWDPLPIGIGLNYGTVIRGDLGSKNRRAHTVIGNAVNISARLCGVAKGREAVASLDIVERVKQEFEFTEPQKVNLKGIPTPFLAYSLQIK